MTAAAAETTKDFEKWSKRLMKLAAVKAWKGALAVVDTSTGWVTKGQVSTTLKVLGVFDETVDNSGGSAGAVSVQVNFLKEKTVLWRANDTGTPVVQANVGSVCYILDDLTVSGSSGSGARSVAGTVLAVDSVLGVAFEVEGL